MAAWSALWMDVVEWLEGEEPLPGGTAEWVYSTPGLEEAIGEQRYLALLELDLGDRSKATRVQKVIRSAVPVSAWQLYFDKQLSGRPGFSAELESSKALPFKEWTKGIRRWPRTAGIRAALAGYRRLETSGAKDHFGREYPAHVAAAVEQWLRSSGSVEFVELQPLTGQCEMLWNQVSGNTGEPAPFLSCATYDPAPTTRTTWVDNKHPGGPDGQEEKELHPRVQAGGRPAC